jgi:hypothetical protein
VREGKEGWRMGMENKKEKMENPQGFEYRFLRFVAFVSFFGFVFLRVYSFSLSRWFLFSHQFFGFGLVLVLLLFLGLRFLFTFLCLCGVAGMSPANL